MEEKSALVVGDGPTGLSAALFLAKNGFTVDVIGDGGTAVRKAMLHNYLGLDVEGPKLLEKGRAQAAAHGARFHEGIVEHVEVGEAFGASVGGKTLRARFLVLATGWSGVPDGLDLEKAEHGVHADRDGRTSMERVYAGGALVRGKKSQVATSVGDGASIAVDLLSHVAGKPTHDYDTL